MEEKKEVWRWNANLAWELFSSAIYNYRLSLKENKEHKRHAYYKTVIINTVTSVEAFINEKLVKEKKWDEGKLKKKSINDKLRDLDIDPDRFKETKSLRNDYIIHHKRIDQLYFNEINSFSAVEAIESAQGILADISFHLGKLFPYWITGLNFININHGNDIYLMNDYEFWRRIKQLGVNSYVNEMVYSTGDVIVPKDKKIYDSLYMGIWDYLKECKFVLKELEVLKDERFPSMPFLTSQWWEK